ncbi:MAG: YceI family protein [Acidimicrobiales bacterium]
MRRWRWWIVGAVAVIVVLAVGGPFVYIHLVEGPPPPKLALPSTRTGGSTTASAAVDASSLDGTYTVGSGSEAGYRVSEVLIGQHSTAVGRTARIWGTVTVAGGAVTSAVLTVDMASVTSDQSERNAQFDGRIMDVAQYPTAALALTEPLPLRTALAVGSKATYTATANLTMHGATRSVTFPLAAERTTSGVYVLADVPVTFAEWGIANPSVGGFVTTADSGTVEVLVHLTKGAGNPAGTGASSAPAPGGAPSPVTVPRTTVPSLTIPNS